MKAMKKYISRDLRFFCCDIFFDHVKFFPPASFFPRNGNSRENRENLMLLRIDPDKWSLLAAERRKRKKKRKEDPFHGAAAKFDFFFLLCHFFFLKKNKGNLLLAPFRPKKNVLQ